MRLGCIGCGVLLVIVFALGVAVAGALFLSVNLFLEPEVHAVAFSRTDGFSAQNKLYELVLRQGGRSARTDPVVITEREANAFVARHLEEAAGLRLNPIVVHFSRGQMLIQGQTVLRTLLQAPPFPQILAYVPDARLDQRVWVTARGRVVLEGEAGDRRYGRFAITEFALGKQPVSGIIVYAMLGPSGGGLLRWPVPAVVQDVAFEDGRAVIRTR